jgi:glycosyltransferase involved in cell wall biosynthesis
MKVALFSQDMSCGTFGAAFSGLANALAANGVTSIDLLTVRGDMAAAEHPFPAGARPIRLAGGRSAGAIWPLRRHLLRTRPDVLISGPIVPNLAAVVASRAALGWRGRLILSHHHPVRLARSQGWQNSMSLVRLLYRFADGSFAVSPAVREEVIEVAGLDPARVGCLPNVLPPAPPLADACPHPWLAPGRAGGPVFVTVSRLEPVKNVPLLIDAFADVAGSLDARLLIAGSGSAEAEIRARIAARGLGQRVQLLGYVTTPRPYLAAADAFVLASNEEGFGQVLSEAMREGLPVISTDAQGGGARFVLDDGRAGMLVPRGDRAALAGALTAMADPGTRRRYAELARARARRFAPEPVGAALLRFIERLPAPGQVALRRH